ncbi:hypothetical protein E3N88_31432 [Mikania micrantha]|uniref:Uncharacterized protein n=1 Tax=Mikania micrantha TaxID=192012 RepID=A0A5N6MQ07_9ASTR|nr:hypothetical protein E3N88_31432 [Mikania micrantha]
MLTSTGGAAVTSSLQRPEGKRFSAAGISATRVRRPGEPTAGGGRRGSGRRRRETRKPANCNSDQEQILTNCNFAIGCRSELENKRR